MKKRIPVIVYMFALLTLSTTQSLHAQMKKTASEKTDRATLSSLNAKFIHNFVHDDTVGHNEIVHKDFLCIESSGAIVGRTEYMKGWASGYVDSGYDTFDYKDEYIRIFGDMALIRSKTVYTKKVNGQEIKGSTIYTDTYIRENGRWWCVQAQLTPVRQ